MKVEEVRDILARIRKVKVAVYGDFCLDAYWKLDPRESELSVETGRKASAIGSHSYSLGGAGNVVANIAALEPASITAIGVIGADPFGFTIVRLLEALRVNTSGMVVQPDDFATMAYCKQIDDHDETARLDFGVFNRRTKSSDKALLTSLREAFKTANVIVLNQQVVGSITNESFIDEVNNLISEFPKKIVILDSRHYGDKFKGVCRKMNQRELSLLNADDPVSDEMMSMHDLKRFAARFHRQSGCPVFVTRGERGIYSFDADGEHETPGVHVAGAVDPVGAGDTVLSALACCLGSGIETWSAADFAGLAAVVTVQKLRQTGTAGGAEIMAMARDADYIYQPELAADPGLASYVRTSEIELCYGAGSLPRGRISHAVFDNDGTLSVLRHGWEAVMERVMVRVILGERY
ncbi:MAG: PfkB family carbohydrate kinase, partial [bacterium]